jgi:hypothetical protein
MIGGGGIFAGCSPTTSKLGFRCFPRLDFYPARAFIFLTLIKSRVIVITSDSKFANTERTKGRTL